MPPHEVHEAQFPVQIVAEQDMSSLPYTQSCTDYTGRHSLYSS